MIILYLHFIIDKDRLICLLDSGDKKVKKILSKHTPFNVDFRKKRFLAMRYGLVTANSKIAETRRVL